MHPFACAFLALLSSVAFAQPYLVLSAVPSDHPYAAAATLLARHRQAPIISFDGKDLDGLRKKLVACRPRDVAIVLEPGQLDANFARQFLVMACSLDDDPFPDFHYGFITGMTAADAEALVRRTIERETKPMAPTIGSLGVWGIAKSTTVSKSMRLYPGDPPRIDGRIADAKHFKETGRDLTYIQEFLPSLEGKSAVVFGGHGLPDAIDGGPRAKDLVGLDLSGAVALNIACYTAVTDRYFLTDFATGMTQEARVPLLDSFCLQLLRCGVVGYTAYLGPRPAGPELEWDLAALVHGGMSLGEARRRDYDKIVLGFLAKGDSRVELPILKDGEPVARHADVVGGLMLDMGTTGVLFGDPAFVPFKPSDLQGPVEVEWKETQGGLDVHIALPATGLFVFGSDPTSSYDGKGEMAMKLVARVPIGDKKVASVTVNQLRVGGKDTPSRCIYALEEDQLKRFLQVKVLFPRKSARGRAEASVTVSFK